MDDPIAGNPYQPPQGASLEAVIEAELVDDTPRNVWRFRNALILVHGDCVLPEACVRTNDDQSIARYSFHAITQTGLWVVIGLMLIPPVGWLLALVVVGVKGLRVGAEFQLPLRSKLRWGLLTLELAFLALLVAGNALVGLRLFYDVPWLVPVGGPMILVAVATFWASDRLYLRTDLLADLIAVRGVDPGYLERLPEFPNPGDERLVRLM